MLYLNKKCVAARLFEISIILLASCSQPALVPMDEQSVISSKKTVHIVGSGDTLYAIAFLSGLDFKQLADWNHISDPYIITRGQKISLVKPADFNRPGSSSVTIKPAQDGQKTPGINAPPKQGAATTTGQQNIEPGLATLRPVFSKFDNTWKWPVSSINIINYRKSSQNKGLDIISKNGVAVVASASGKVVYAGNGLKGYGNLIIIKHNDTYLSAYAHNKSINVNEGDLIGQGQKIAEVGSSESKQIKLHFEIRKNGAPVNPLGLLPKKVG